MCTGGLEVFAMVVHPAGQMVPYYGAAPAIKLHSLPIPIHSQPFLHNDSTKVHSEKARPFFGEYCSKKYKMCRMYTDVQCFEQC